MQEITIYIEKLQNGFTGQGRVSRDHRSALSPKVYCPDLESVADYARSYITASDSIVIDENAEEDF